MNKAEGTVLLNRVVSFLAGGLLVFAVMSFTVVDSAKKKNTELTAMLDASRYEAGRLFADAKAQLGSREYAKAKESLTMLFQKQPGSAESIDGKKLLAVVETAEKAADAKWAAAVVGMQKKWSADRAVELRAESEKTRTQMEKDMEDKIGREWETAMKKIKEEWLKTVSL